MCTSLRHPPMLNLTDLCFIHQPLFTGFVISLIPAIIASMMLYGFYWLNIHLNIPGSYTDIDALTSTRINKYRGGIDIQ